MCMCLFLCMVCVVLNCVLCVLRVVQVRVLLVLRGQPRGDPRRAPGVARRRHGEGPVEEVGTLPEQTLLRTEGAVRQTAVRPRDGGLQSAADTERYEYLALLTLYSTWLSLSLSLSSVPYSSSIVIHRLTIALSLFPFVSSQIDF